MQRNRIVYFIIAVVLIAVGYIVRITDVSVSSGIGVKKFAMEGSFIFIAMGFYFLTAIIIRKGAAWVCGAAAFVVLSIPQLFRLMEYGWYNSFYDGNVGRIIIGGPFEPRLFVYIFIGMILGAALELLLRQYNQIGLGN